MKKEKWENPMPGFDGEINFRTTSLTLDQIQMLLEGGLEQLYIEIEHQAIQIAEAEARVKNSEEEKINQDFSKLKGEILEEKLKLNNFTKTVNVYAQGIDGIELLLDENQRNERIISSLYNLVILQNMRFNFELFKNQHVLVSTESTLKGLASKTNQAKRINKLDLFLDEELADMLKKNPSYITNKDKNILVKHLLRKMFEYSKKDKKSRLFRRYPDFDKWWDKGINIIRQDGNYKKVAKIVKEKLTVNNTIG